MAGFPIVVAYDPPDMPTRSRNEQPLLDLYYGCGCEPTRVPGHLSRVLFLPKHEAPDFPIYDVSQEFQRALYNPHLGSNLAPIEPFMGSRLFNIRLANLNRPTGTGGDDVQYLVSSNETLGCYGDTAFTVRKRDASNSIPDVNL